jgi:GTP 3',8-cyclase
MIIKKIIFWHSRKTPLWMRNFLGISFFFYVKLRNILIYKNKDLFHHVNIELNRNCNRRCTYCPVSKYPKFKRKEKINFKNYSKIINQLKAINFSGEIHFTGFYEPLTEKDLPQYIRYAKENLKLASITVYTNGDFLNEKILKCFRELSVFLIISLHGEKKHSKRWKEITEITEKNQVIIKTSLEKQILSSRGNLVNIKKREKKRNCVLPSIELNIDVSGNVILCADDFFSKNTFGNIKKESLVDIWNKREFKKTRKNILLGKSDLNICKSCFF